jgi:hypothetical protein
MPNVAPGWLLVAMILGIVIGILLFLTLRFGPKFDHTVSSALGAFIGSLAMGIMLNSWSRRKR